MREEIETKRILRRATRFNPDLRSTQRRLRSGIYSEAFMSMCPLRELSRSSLYGRISAVIGGAVFSCAAVLAQQIGVTYSAAAQTDVAPKSLSPASQAVMERLSHLGEIPIDDLRYYAGDFPNGGAVGVDDSVWQKIQLPFSAPSGPIWLRKRIEVPKTLEGYDPTGAKIWLREPSRGGVVP
jgi:hypothetical protein